MRRIVENRFSENRHGENRSGENRLMITHKGNPLKYRDDVRANISQSNPSLTSYCMSSFFL